MTLTSLFLDMKNKNVLIVGTGEVGIRRTRRFLDTQAKVHIITKHIDPEIKEEFQQKGAKFYDNTHLDDLIKKCDLIVAATNNQQLNDEIATKAQDKLINCASNTKLSNVIVPSTFKIGDVTVSLYTGSKSPLMAKKLRKKIQQTITTKDIQNIQLQENIRQTLKDTIDEQQKRKQFMQQITQNEEIQNYLENNKPQKAEKKALELLKEFTIK